MPYLANIAKFMLKKIELKDFKSFKLKYWSKEVIDPKNIAKMLVVTGKNLVKKGYRVYSFCVIDKN